MSTLADYLAKKQIIVCCGAGGVGKTTVSAALALAAARRGRRVLVLTIDPSRRLAETMGIARNRPEPLPLAEQKQAAGGIKPPGVLSAWVLDPGLVADRTIARLASSPQETQRLLQNRIYKDVTRMVAGMQEYTAVEALHALLRTGNYDLIVLDTPPSRNALNFLDAPTRLGRFLDGRIFKLFLPREEGLIRGAATRLIWKVLGTVLGEEFYSEFRSFLKLFSGMLSILGGNAKDMKAMLQRSTVTFLLVTTNREESIADALYFQSRLRRLQLHCGGFVLNRSLAPNVNLRYPDRSLLPPLPTEHHLSVLEKLVALARVEQQLAERDVEVLHDFRERAGETVATVPVPEIPGGVDDMDSLGRLVDWLEENELDVPQQLR